jgi:hypothetical protein
MNKPLLIAIFLISIFSLQIIADDAPKSSPVYNKVAAPKGAVFFETFDEGWKERWIPSTNEKYSRGTCILR